MDHAVQERLLRYDGEVAVWKEEARPLVQFQYAFQILHLVAAARNTLLEIASDTRRMSSAT